MIFLIFLMFGVSATAGVIDRMAQNADPERVKCTTVGGPIPLGTERVTVPMKCCPRDFYISDPAHPTDNKGNLICTRET